MEVTSGIMLLVLTAGGINLCNAVCDTGTNCLAANGLCNNDICWCLPNKGGTECTLGCTTTTCTVGTDACTDTDDCTACPTGAAACDNGDCGSTGYPTVGVACDCDAGWTGAACETEKCDGTKVCQNGGTCGGDDLCDCAAGYTGDLCDEVECGADAPCLSGSCTDGTGGNPDVCTCPTGITGLICDEFTCPGTGELPCVNGTCSAPNTCSCTAGSTGLLCDTSVDDCASNPCLNGGTCIDGHISYTCTCATEYTGVDCESGASGIAASLLLMLVTAVALAVQ